MQAAKVIIENLFNKGRVLDIPFFQRSYVWTSEDWERFFSDMQMVSKQGKDYFMGSIILKAQQTSSVEKIGDQRLVVDGQQRLTTIILFYKALCEAKNNPTLFKNTFFNRGQEIILKHNHNDLKIFEAIVYDKLNDSLKNDYKDNNILKSYLYFKEMQKDLQNIDTDTLLNKLYFVGIDLGADEDEQQIFDTINSLGVILTTAELLKNELFRRADETLYNATWKLAFEKDESVRAYWDQEVTGGRLTRINMDLLLQAFLLIVSEAKDKYMGLEGLFSNYKQFIKDSNIDNKDLVHKLIEYARIYQQNFDPDLLNRDIDKDSPIERLNAIIFGLNITTILPFALYVLKEVASKEEQEKIFKLLESYLVRRLICRETTKNYNNMFASFIRNKINTYELFKETIYTSEDPTNRFPDNASLKKGFEESTLSNPQAKVMLYLLEKSIREDKYSTNLLAVNEYSLEHIMPKQWRNNWVNNLSDEQANLRDPLLLKLGNLTIITMSLNGAIRDASWDVKKHGKNGKKGLDEYAKGIKIFDKYLKLDTWDESSIISRGNDLFEFAKTVWGSEMPVRSKLSSAQQTAETISNNEHPSVERGSEMSGGGKYNEDYWETKYPKTQEAATALKDILNDDYGGILEVKYLQTRISLYANGKRYFAFVSGRGGTCGLWYFVMAEDKEKVLELLRKASLRSEEGKAYPNSDGSECVEIWMPDVDKSILFKNAKILKEVAVFVNKIWE